MAFKMKGHELPGPNQRKKSPVKVNWGNFLDKAQTALTVGGMTPAWGIVPDAVNTVISTGRAGYAGLKGNKKAMKKHMINAGVNAATMVPGFGQGVATTKLLAQSGKMGLKALKNTGTKKVLEYAAKKVPKVVVKKGTQPVVEAISDNSKKTKNMVEKRNKKNYDVGITNKKSGKNNYKKTFDFGKTNNYA